MYYMYEVVDYENKFAVKNMSDGLLLKSKESGNVIAFNTFQQAEKVKDFFDNQYNLIVQASQYWHIKEKSSSKACFIIQITKTGNATFP